MEKIKAAVRSGNLLYSFHADLRLLERKILKPEIEYVLLTGFHEVKKDQFDSLHQSWNYSIRGKTVDYRKLRIVVALVKPNVLIITAIDLDH